VDFWVNCLKKKKQQKERSIPGGWVVGKHTADAFVLKGARQWPGREGTTAGKQAAFSESSEKKETKKNG